MKLFKLIGVALMAVFVLSAAMAVSAFALPTILPAGVTAFTGKKAPGSRNAILEKSNGETITCTEAKGENGTIEQPKPLGLFHISFEGCTAFGFSCTGLGDATGILLSLGSWHLVEDTLPNGKLNEAGIAILFLPGTTHFTCLTELVVVNLGGMVLCLILNPLALTKIFEFHCNLRPLSKGEPEDTKYYNENGTLTSIVYLLSSKNEATAELSAENALGTIEFNQPVLLDY